MASRTVIISIALFLNVLSINAIHPENNYQIAQKSRSRAVENKQQFNHEGNQRNARQGHAPKSDGAPVAPQQPAEQSYHYRPFEAAPKHIKQLIYQAYAPQQPHVNPHAFLYNMNPPIPYPDSSVKNSVAPESDNSNTEQPSQSSFAYRTPNKPPPPAHTIARVNKVPQQSGIRYVRDDVKSPHSNLQNHNNFYSQQEPVKRSPEIHSPVTKYSNDYEEQHEEVKEKKIEQRDNKAQGMPGEIKQLLHYQAQIPYNVLANHIAFKSQKPFIPKPLSGDVINHSSSYPHEILYVKSDGQVFEERNDEMIQKE